ncbi:hypothetical protein MFIFM68171_04002 [Madurella fahalii]|uniref:Zn(2)-C6 fungal-type domain-containing protein n=1 Tax=Madurella fahalii TaxID=1157608 RepID=A0ABQ0G7Q2_9PEZI
MSASPRPHRRTANTCVTCRARKVRCDGRRGICTNCERLDFACSYDENANVEMVQGGSHGAPISVPRRRARQACQNCHARKARCSGSLPSCDRCRAQGLECVYRPGKRSLPLPSPSAAPSPGAAMHDDAQIRLSSPNDRGTSASSTASPAPAVVAHHADPAEVVVLRAFDSFFRHVHHIPMFSFLHRASLMERYHAGTLDRSLILALVGITALLTDLGPGMEDYGNRCIQEAVSVCLAELEKPSIPRLQTLVIAVKHRILSKRYSGAFMLHAIASRFATALRLNHESPDLCFLARESRRRLVWSLYMIDSFISAGQPDLALWPDAEHQIHVQLPCNERNFEFDLPEPTELLRPPAPDPAGVIPPLPDVLGFMALHVRIQWMRTRILQCTSKVIASPSEVLSRLPGQCAELAAELEAFEARLPQSFRWSENNLRLRTYSPRLGIFIMTHVWWRQCHLDLYRLFLPGLREALAPAALQQLDPHFATHKRRSCYEHARAMADMFAQLLALGSSAPVTDLDMPGCAFQCSRVLYHSLQTDGGNLGFTQERVQELASVCLRAARQSTAGPASASIQADIERLIANGLSLPEVPPALPSRTRGLAVGMDMPYLGQPMPSATHTPAVALPPGPINRTQVEHLQMPMPGLAVTPIDPLGLPMAETVMPSVAPASQTSVGTSASNAFEEVADGLNFGSEWFGPESWSVFSPGWSNFGHFPGTSA